MTKLLRWEKKINRMKRRTLNSPSPSSEGDQWIEQYFQKILVRNLNSVEWIDQIIIHCSTNEYRHSYLCLPFDIFNSIDSSFLDSRSLDYYESEMVISCFLTVWKLAFDNCFIVLIHKTISNGESSLSIFQTTIDWWSRSSLIF